MRTAFIKTLTDLAAQDERIMLLVGDLGFGVVTDFANQFPKQFLNVGVAEQNMAGVAAGLAHSGKIVFTYSIGNFPILRCLEQIRNDICYPRANVISVCVGGGLCYGSLGMSHHATEDIAIMRSLPEIAVFAPGDPIEATAITEYLAQGTGPAYLRLGRAGEPIVHEKPIDWQFGKILEVRAGREIMILATGSMLKTAVSVADQLKTDHSLEASVVSVPTIKPIDATAIVERANKARIVLTLEEHSIIGGLGTAVADVLVDHHVFTRFKRFGLPPQFVKEIGDQEYLCKHYGLDVDTLVISLVQLDCTQQVIADKKYWNEHGTEMF